MRDILLMVIIMGGSCAALWRPWIGVIMWTWVSLMNPHVQFGYAVASWPVASIVAVCTLAGMLFTRDKQNPFTAPPAWTLLAFALWMTLMLPLALYLDPSLPLWERSMKIFLMIFVTVALINTRTKLNWFVWTMVVSIGYYGVKGGAFTLATGGNYRVWGPGGFIEGNNEVALAIVTIIPLMRFGQLQLKRAWAKHIASACIALAAIAALGSHSRGAVLGVGAMGFFLWLKTDKKVLWAILIVGFSATLLPMMPEAWWERMYTIETYKSDESALGRLNAWAMAWNLAVDRFPIGGGMSMYTQEVFGRYAPNPDQWLQAHSIYFQILGELGFLGLALFLTLFIQTWLMALNLVRLGRQNAELHWAADLGSMIQVSLVGFAVGGAFLSLAYFDLPYNLTAAALIATSICRRSLASAGAPKGAQIGDAAAPDARLAK